MGVAVNGDKHVYTKYQRYETHHTPCQRCREMKPPKASEPRLPHSSDLQRTLYHKAKRQLSRRLSAIRPLRAGTVVTSQLDPDSIVNGVADPLLASKVSFGCLQWKMSKQKLDLV